MTATPIPRTLGQVLYADLDVSTLRAAPTGRIPIRTGIRRPEDLEGTWDRVRQEAAAGHRTFVVVPRIGAARGRRPAAKGDEDAGWARRRRAARRGRRDRLGGRGRGGVRAA